MRLFSCVYKVYQGHTNIVHVLANTESTFHNNKVLFFGQVHALCSTEVVWGELAKVGAETFCGVKLQ